ncbi:DUF2147 domain-containing protein [Arsenicitalea aurantiaca]|uniref:DUF2147 domain-containing protein n=1 Tax=Arsenicitalea aurantiaca TaxID=1783274 RepID=A0A433XAU9_9HYPH|nr:DUF2147 domain-containing protein [Arsenicitalea aurantiaca]RUT31217.1 DUF2147 domain-containing protein [Arsenicitalea aurantiaca]
MTLLKTLSFATLALAFAAAPAISADASPVGTWQQTTGESRYQVAMCGDGTQLCATLVWLREDARTAENLRYLNKTVVQARPSAVNKWRGTVQYEGQAINGSVTLVDGNTLKVNGCQFIACQSFELKRV